jgi:hypothetical protein
VVNKLKGQQDNFVPKEHYKILSDAYDSVEEEKGALKLKLEAITRDYENLLKLHNESKTMPTLNSVNKKAHIKLFISDNFMDLCTEVNDKMNASVEVCNQCKEISNNPITFARWVYKHIISSHEFEHFNNSEEVRERNGISEDDSLREEVELQIIKVATVNKEMEAVQSTEYLDSFQSELISILKQRLSKHSSITDLDNTINEYSLLIREPEYLDFSAFYSSRVYKDSTKCISISTIPLLVFLRCQLIGYLACVFHKKFTEGENYPLLGSITALMEDNADRVKSIM